MAHEGLPVDLEAFLKQHTPHSKTRAERTNEEQEVPSTHISQD